jgi:uncharacterized protein DUF5924/DUF2914 family protein
VERARSAPLLEVPHAFGVGSGTLHGPPNPKLGRNPDLPAGEGGVFVGDQTQPGLRTRFRVFLHRHGRKLWWLHSAYALALGASVVVFAQKGFGHARWLAVTLGLAWLLVVLIFRLFASGGEMRAFDAADTKTRVHFYVMTYALKNLYQGMLFFLLPFYWKSTTLDAANGWFVVLLGVCALLSTLDIVFDRVLMRWRALASLFHGITLFGCLNLVIPALFPDTRTLWSLLAAAAITVVGFWTLHVTLRVLRKKMYIAVFALSLASGVAAVYAARAAIPPVPMYVSSAAVGPKQLSDGRLAMEVKTLHPSVIQELIAVTDVVVPGGKGDRLRHVWLRERREVHRSSEETSRIEGPKGVVRLRSSLTEKDLPPDLVGAWSVDVETEDGQLVGRTEFRVVP